MVLSKYSKVINPFDQIKYISITEKISMMIEYKQPNNLWSGTKCKKITQTHTPKGKQLP